jgi:diguanylate cyclase (GGDEF)-like protein/PAS domain S-box-containing protein
MNLKFRHLRSIKTRVTLLTLAIFVLSIWTISFYVNRALQGDMQRVLGEHEFLVASTIADEINHDVQERMDMLEAVAAGLASVLPRGAEPTQKLLEDRPIFQRLFNLGSFVTGTDGTAIASFPVSVDRVGINYMDRDHVADALKEGRSSVSKPVIGKAQNQPVVSMAVPVRDPQGKVIGALIGVTDLGKPNFLEKISKASFNKSATVSLIATQHRVTVTSTDKKLVMLALPPPGVNPYLDRNIAGFEGYTIVVNVLGQEQLASIKKIPAAQWYLYSGLPTAEVFAPVHRLQQGILLTAIVLILLAGSFTWWILKRQLDPMFDIAKKLAHMAEAAETPQPLPMTRQDEIGELIGGFNRLLETLGRREKALQKSEQNFAITLNSIGDAVIATDPDGRITSMNPMAERMCGWTLADALGHPLTDVFCIVNATTRKPEVDPVHVVMTKGQVVGLANHTVLLAKGGREYQIADSAAPIRDASDQIVGVVLVFSDVTEKYRAELALRESEQRFRELYEKAPLPYQSLDIEGKILEVNEAWLAMLGYAREEVMGRFIGDFLTETSLETLGCEFPRLKTNGRIDGPEFDISCKNGMHKRVVINGRIGRDNDGNFQRTHCILTDITDRKQAEAKLQLAASVFVNAGEGITITDTQGTIVDVNAAFTRITGYSREQAIGQNPRILKSGRQDSAFYKEMWRNLTEQGRWSGEIWNRHQDGATYAELLTINSLRDTNGDVQQYMGFFSDITAIKTQQSQLEHLAHFDALTNLPNRVLLADRLQQAMAQMQRRGQQLAVVFLDLDGFKSINDLHGHEAGDRVLIALTQRLKLTLREGDTLARLGGDEFVAVLSDLESTAACLPLVNRLLETAAQPMQFGELQLQLSASVGITFFPQTHDIDADQLLRQADQAMYQAKVAGKNRYQIFDAEQDSSIRVHHESLERIRLALAHQEFVLHYQPKVNMHSGRVVGAEALIRWQHPERGLLAPAIFLSVIEDHKLAIDLGEWVIDAAMHQIELWHAAGLDLPVSVNIGARQLQQSDFMKRLQAIFARHPQVRPGCIELEILETSALADMAQVSRVIEECAEIGVKFALDDFGTGYSSLTYLKRLRVATLKIDQSFVRDMLDDPDDLAILQGVIGLAAAFKREVIAEGVETVAHGSALLQLGCELAQGYGIARPMPAEQMLAWVANWLPDPAWSELPWLGGAGDSQAD